MPAFQIENLNKKLSLLPNSAGVYIMQDEAGVVIYVGKAKNLKNRVRQYFRGGTNTAKSLALISNIADFYYIIAASETEALSLENNLIKKYKPKYNILLKDDKTYPYLRVNLKEKFPRFTVTRRVRKDCAKYFGPYMGGVAVKDILALVELAFSLRSCAVLPKRECLNYHIKKCPAPCTGRISQSDYFENVTRAVDFLNGQDSEIEQVLTQKMQNFAKSEEFELALMYRERLNILSKLGQSKITALSSMINADIIALTNNGIYLSVNVLITRGGRMQGAKYFALKSVYENDNEALTAFIVQFYTKNQIPDEIITHSFAESGLIEDYLRGERKKAVKVTMPSRGAKRALLNMAIVNAGEYLEKQVDKIKHKDEMTKLACARLKEVLNLKKYPRRMECFDISNISGTDKVGSMAVFIDGEPDRTSYRRFKIKTVEGANDYAALCEVLTRRLSALETNAEHFPPPDLIVIDGGKGQLSAVMPPFIKSGIDADIIALAERDEEIYTQDGRLVRLEKSDYALRLLQRIRDEAHRFAITFHRSLRSKRTLSSVLTNIAGVGEKRRKALLQRFKSIDNILSAAAQEIAKTDGISLALAVKIEKYFKDEINK